MSEPAKTREPRRKRRFIVILLLAAVGLALWWGFFRGPEIPPGTVVLLDLGEPVPERSEAGVRTLLSGPAPDLLEVSRALASAAADDRVLGLLVRIRAGGLGPGRVDELRSLLAGFRASGKFVIAQAIAPDTLAYFLATSADEILLDRSTTLDAVGIRLTAFFLKDMLAQWGIEADLVRVGDFKGAYEELALPGPTPQFEETMNALADSIHASITSSVASARGLEERAVHALFDRCPLRPDEALGEKLVDRLVGPGEVTARLEERTAQAIHLVLLDDYLKACGRGARSERRLAVVHVLGTILEGETRVLPWGGWVTGADTFVKAVREAAADASVLGILLRIDSPGGVVSAAEKMFHAVDAARKKKPVVASLGGTAASGGYYAACAADKIFAHATSLTGSIGVFGGKMVIGSFLEKHRIEVRTYVRGKRAGMSDFSARYNLDERLALKDLLEDSYRGFVSRVAAGRKRSFEEIHAVAQGRVWTGKAAMGAGLVDEMGGVVDALAALRSLARLPGSEPCEVQVYPPRQTLWESIRGRRPGEPSLSFAGAAPGDALVSELRAWLGDLGLVDGSARLALLPFVPLVR